MLVARVASNGSQTDGHRDFLHQATSPPIHTQRPYPLTLFTMSSTEGHMPKRLEEVRPALSFFIPTPLSTAFICLPMVAWMHTCSLHACLPLSLDTRALHVAMLCVGQLQPPSCLGACFCFLLLLSASPLPFSSHQYGPPSPLLSDQLRPSLLT